MISEGAAPFYFDKNSKNTLDYIGASDPIKSHILLNDLLKISTNTSQKEILKHYISIAIKAGGGYED